jgi:hypothetical protein
MPSTRHAFRLLLLAFGAALQLLGGCAGNPSAPNAESHLSFDRTFAVARGALTDQKLAIGQEDRRSGIIVGTGNGVTITVTLVPLPDGALRVTFREQPEGADPALLKRVTDAYAARMAQHGVFSGFKGSGGGGGGPVPCPSGPAFCN